MKNDMDFLKDKIENSGVKAPADMDESYVVRTLENVYPQPIAVPQKPKRRLKAIVASAAVFVLVATIGVIGGVHFYQQNAVRGKEIPLSGGLSLRQFRSHDELKAEIDSIRAERNKINLDDVLLFTDHFKGDYDAADPGDNYLQGGYIEDSVSDSYAISSDIGMSGTSSDSFSETYKQVEGVDEADIIKTDGKYIYCADYYNYDSPCIDIFAAKEGDNLPAVRLDIGEQAAATPDEADTTRDEECFYDISISDFYLRNNRLIVMCDDYRDDVFMTTVFVYDISDIHNITLLDSMRQSGYYISSRMIGDTLYTVSSYDVYRDNYFPVCGQGATPDEIPADCIYAVTKPEYENYLVVSAYNTLDYSKQTQSKALFGGAEDIYCNKENLYIYATQYDFPDGVWYSDYHGANAKSQILKVNLTDNLSFTAYAEVEGYIDDQYALDEYNGNLRVATTSMRDNEDINNLFILDESLNVIGSVTGFAENESIKAVRYVDDTAYVITYEQTDPLFVIDLSEPTAPEILGEVKISGFSTMLVPIDENTILGLGYHTENEDYTDLEVQEGVKLALFDVSDKSNPKVLDSMSFVDYDSPVQYNPKALVYNPERGDYVIPLNYHKYYTAYDEWYGGMLNFKVENGKISVVSQYQANYDSDVERCVYVGDTVYMTHSGSGGMRLDSVKYQ